MKFTPIWRGRAPTAEHIAELQQALTDLPRLNLLTNGGFEVWQRGVGPVTAAGAYTADRWVLQGATSTLSVSRIASTIGYRGYSAQFAYTHAAGGYGGLAQFVSDLAPQLAGQTATFAIRVKASVAGALYARIEDYAGAYASTPSTPNQTTGEEVLTVTRQIVAGATSIDVGLILTASCTVEINDATLIVGPTPAPYLPLHPADELARCLRYYEVFNVSYPRIDFAAYAVGAWGEASVCFAAVKAKAPTVTKNGTWAVGACNQPTIVTSDIHGFALAATATSIATQAYTNFAAGCSVTAEANP